MKTVLSIPGMHCNACETLIRDVSLDFPEITAVEVDLDTKTVTLEHGDEADLQPWKAAITLLGDSYAIVS